MNSISTIMKRIILFLTIILSCLQLQSQDMRYKPDMGYELNYTGFVIDYNSIGRCPNFVYYTIESDKLDSWGRLNFWTDYSVKGYSESWEYANSPYDRGHVMPSASSQNIYMWEDCYSMANIVPQPSELNRKLWKYIEEFERKNCDPILYIITGNIGWKTDMKTGIRVPAFFYKVLYNPSTRTMIGFICDEHDANKDPYEVAVPVKVIEQMSGINFFKQMPQPLQYRLESTIDVESWNW